ncbi:hypothetical protein COCNU_08G010850 [Cocos nucifera]|uniref:rRNA 2'-O-methyltransferase fibrillarin n=1 Tax=Cocos nucifera TaxID=13894 RepID=A0A8K0N6U3_COCNU|nr:hypothetical protein COCNU_08G010850 [Cocos nucifera]
MRPPRGGGRGAGPRGRSDGGGRGRGRGAGGRGGRGGGRGGMGRGGGRGGMGRGGGRGGMKGGSKVIVQLHRHDGVFVAKGKEDALCTRNMVAGESVYGEKRVSVQGPGSRILYLGAVSGTTVSHVSDIVGPVSSFTAVNILDKCIVIMI